MHAFVQQQSQRDPKKNVMEADMIMHETDSSEVTQKLLKQNFIEICDRT